MTCIHPGCTNEPISNLAQYCARHRAGAWVARRWRAKRDGNPMGTSAKPCRVCGEIFSLTAPNQQYCLTHKPAPKAPRDRPPKRVVERQQRIRTPQPPKPETVYIRPFNDDQQRVNQLLRAWPCVRYSLSL